MDFRIFDEQTYPPNVNEPQYNAAHKTHCIQHYTSQKTHNINP